MKHKGSVMHFHSQRNTELMRAYRAALLDVHHVRVDEIFTVVVNTPCSRFWVSEERAAVVLTALLRGEDPLSSMRPPKQEMFRELLRRVKELQQQQPDEPFPSLVFQAVNSPAPKFYMHPDCAHEIIYAIRRQMRTNPATRHIDPRNPLYYYRRRPF